MEFCGNQAAKPDFLDFLDCSNRCKTYAKRRVSMSSFWWYRAFVCTTFVRRATAILLQHSNSGPNVVYDLLTSVVVVVRPSSVRRLDRRPSVVVVVRPSSSSVVVRRLDRRPSVVVVRRPCVVVVRRQ